MAHRHISPRHLILPVAAWLLLMAGSALAASVNLAWDAASGSVSGYKVYYGTASGKYTGSVSAGAATAATVTSLAAGQKYFFAATSLDSAGTESAYSNEVSATTASGTGTGTGGTGGSGSPLDGGGSTVEGDIDVTVANVEFEGKLSFTAAAVSGATTYTWNYGDGSAAATTTTPQVTHQFAKAGAYDIVCTAFDASGKQLATSTVHSKVTAGALQAAAKQENGASVTLGTASYSDITGDELAANYTLSGRYVPLRTLIDFTATGSADKQDMVFQFQIFDLVTDLTKVKLIKLRDDGTTIDYTYAATGDATTDGSWWITDASGAYVAQGTALAAETVYTVNFVVGDNGSYDLDTTAKVIRDPVTLVTTADAPSGTDTPAAASDSGSSSGGSGGGCTYAPGAELGLELLIPALGAALLRLRRRSR
jgi:hypothetical protein